MRSVCDRMMLWLYIVFGLSVSSVSSAGESYVPIRIYYWDKSIEFDTCNRTFTSRSNISHVSFLTEVKIKLHFLTDNCFCIFHYSDQARNSNPSLNWKDLGLETELYNVDFVVRRLLNGTWPIWFSLTESQWKDSYFGLPYFNLSVQSYFRHPRLFIHTGNDTVQSTERPTSVYVNSNGPLNDVVLTCSPSIDTFTELGEEMTNFTTTHTGGLIPLLQPSTLEKNLIIGLSGCCAFLLVLTVVFIIIINKMRKNINKLKNEIIPKQRSISNRSAESIRYTPDGYLQPLPSVRSGTPSIETVNSCIQDMNSESQQLQRHEYLELGNNVNQHNNIYEELQSNANVYIGDSNTENAGTVGTDIDEGLSNQEISQSTPASVLNSRRPSGSYQQIDDNNSVVLRAPNPYLVLVS